MRDWQEVLTLSGRDDAGSGIAWRGHFFRAFGDIDTHSFSRLSSRCRALSCFSSKASRFAFWSSQDE